VLKFSAAPLYMAWLNFKRFISQSFHLILISWIVLYSHSIMQQVTGPQIKHILIQRFISVCYNVDCVWNVMAHAQKPDFVFQRNGRVHLNRRGRQFSRLLTAEVCASAVVKLATPCSEVVWRVLATHSIRQFPLHFPFRASPCAITFQLDSTSLNTQINKQTRLKHWKGF
jgi:hypothetical protein